MRTVEILSYILKPGSGERFHEIMTVISVPMQRRHGIDVLAFGPSHERPDRYMLVRSFNDERHRQQQLDQFYSDADWRLGPREEIVASIESAIPTTVVVDDDMVNAFARLALGRVEGAA